MHMHTRTHTHTPLPPLLKGCHTHVLSCAPACLVACPHAWLAPAQGGERGVGQYIMSQTCGIEQKVRGQLMPSLSTQTG